jgi:hypothetical protein
MFEDESRTKLGLIFTPFSSQACYAPSSRRGTGRFTVANPTAKVAAITGQQDCTVRQGGNDLRKLRGKGLVANSGGAAATTSRSWPRIPSLPCSPCATRSSPPSSRHPQPQANGRKPAGRSAAARDYGNLRIGMQALFQHLGFHAALP